MGTLYTDQRGLVHEQSLVWPAECSGIALEILVRRSRGTPHSFYARRRTGVWHTTCLSHLPSILCHPNMRFCILFRVDYCLACLAPSGIIQSHQKEKCLGLHTII